MDQPFGKPPKKQVARGEDSPDGCGGVSNISSEKDESHGARFVNDGQLYDDPAVGSGSGEGGGSLYDNFGSLNGSGDGAGRSNGFAESVIEAGEREITLSGGPGAASGDEDGGEAGKNESKEHGSPREQSKSRSGAGTAARPADAKGGTNNHFAGKGGRTRRSSAPSKGSAPSWLKSRLYKGEDTSEDGDKITDIREQVIRNSPVGTAVIDNRGRIRLSNDAFNQAIGLGTDEAVKDIEEVGERVGGLSIENKFWDAVESGSDLKIEEQVYIQGRGQTRIRVSFQPVTFRSGTSWCVCYFEVVAASSPVRSQLWEYQNYVACVATSSGDAIVGLDMEGNIKYWNQGAQALFGYTDDEVVGKSVMLTVPEELRRDARLVLKVVKEQGIYKNYDTSRIHKNGKRIRVTMTVAAVRNEDGEMIGTAATVKDLRSTRDLHEKALEAEKLNAVLQMAVTVYHQINNPLCVIAANSQLLLTRIRNGDADEAKKLESILEATKRISTVLEDLGRLTGVEPQISAKREKK